MTTRAKVIAIGAIVSLSGFVIALTLYAIATSTQLGSRTGSWVIFGIFTAVILATVIISTKKIVEQREEQK